MSIQSLFGGSTAPDAGGSSARASSSNAFGSTVDPQLLLALGGLLLLGIFAVLILKK
jgi:hypothetical protein